MPAPAVSLTNVVPVPAPHLTHVIPIPAPKPVSAPTGNIDPLPTSCPPSEFLSPIQELEEPQFYALTSDFDFLPSLEDNFTFNNTADMLDMDASIELAVEDPSTV